MKMTCAACSEVVKLPEKVGFRDVCSSCDAWLHACVNCSFWEKSSCTEPSAEKVRDPEGQNFCEWFKSKQEPGAGSQEPVGRNAAEEMWRKLTKK